MKNQRLNNNVSLFGKKNLIFNKITFFPNFQRPLIANLKILGKNSENALREFPKGEKFHVAIWQRRQKWIEWKMR